MTGMWACTFICAYLVHLDRSFLHAACLIKQVGLQIGGTIRVWSYDTQHVLLKR
jgi:hypothetical protein